MILEVSAKRRNVRGAVWASAAKEIVILGPDNIRWLLTFDENIQFWVCLSIC